MSTSARDEFIMVCGSCGFTTNYYWITCPCCDWWSPPENIDLEVRFIMQTYESCPLCGGWRWKWIPFDTDASQPGGTGDAHVEPCRCPPEVRKKVKIEKEKEEKERQPQIIVCPNCNQELCIFLEEKDERLLHT